MNETISTTITAALSNRLLLSHPFYQRWEAGELDLSELTSYAEQYRFFEAMLPSFLSKLQDSLPEGMARSSVAANLADEISSPSHLELFETFAQAFAAEDAEISPAMANLLAAYDSVLHGSAAQALAGLFAYETQGAAIADSKADGLARHYGASGAALDFWHAHGSIEIDHAAWTLDALESLEPTLEEVASGTRIVADAWWAFLDERNELVAA